MSQVLYGSVKITSYDHVAESTAEMAGGGFGGGFRAPAAEAAAPTQPQHRHQLASLLASAWHHAPHTSRLMPTIANVHEIEAGNHGE